MPSPVAVFLAAVGAGAVGLAAYGAVVERNNFRLRHESVPILDPGSDPINILHLSDIHMAPWLSSTANWVRSLADTTPDLVVGTGDFLGHPEGLAALSQALEPFHGIPGVVTHGSNDRVAPSFKNPFGYLIKPSSPEGREGVPMNFEGLLALYADLGWHDIDNDAIRMTIKGSTLDLVGVGDAHYQLDRLEELPGRVERLKEADDEDLDSPHASITTIGVTHAPYRRVLDALVTQGVELVFAGHTHGGQVCLPGGKALTTNCDLPLDQASGLGTWRHAQRAVYLQVSAGLGTSVYAPIRLFCPPEAVLVTLVAKDREHA
jgi:predicted MPP superfamily phosphohydrolase